jgi:hypothetical protein
MNTVDPIDLETDIYPMLNITVELDAHITSILNMYFVGEIHPVIQVACEYSV